NGYIDRHGKPRFYFRRAGFKRVPLPGLPWSQEFMAAYEQALAGQPKPAGAARVLPGTIRALAVSYYNSLAFRSMKANTQSVYQNILDRFCRERDKEDQEYGNKIAAHAAKIQTRHSSLERGRDRPIRGAASDRDKAEAGPGARAVHRASAPRRDCDGAATH